MSHQRGNQISLSQSHIAVGSLRILKITEFRRSQTSNIVTHSGRRVQAEFHLASTVHNRLTRRVALLGISSQPVKVQPSMVGPQHQRMLHETPAAGS